MKLYFTLYGILTTTALAAPKAGKEPSMSERIEQCEHWAGQEAYDGVRRKEIESALARLKCNDLDPHVVWLTTAEKKLARADSDACHQFFMSPELQQAPTAIARPGNVMASQCAKRAMNRILDQRLLPLKKSDPQAFKMEMALQKSFNQAASSHCGKIFEALAVCASTGDFRPAAQCEIQLYNYRAEQGKQMLASKLELGEASMGTTKPESSAFNDFAKKLCQLDIKHWAGGRRPSSCESLVLASISMQLVSSTEACSDESIP